MKVFIFLSYYQIFKIKQKVLGRTNRLLPFTVVLVTDTESMYKENFSVYEMKSIKQSNLGCCSVGISDGTDL
jgi:hypothetical protein